MSCVWYNNKITVSLQKCEFPSIFDNANSQSILSRVFDHTAFPPGWRACRFKKYPTTLDIDFCVIKDISRADQQAVESKFKEVEAFLS